VVEGGNLLCEMIMGGRDRVEPEEAEGGAQCVFNKYMDVAKIEIL